MAGSIPHRAWNRLVRQPLDQRALRQRMGRLYGEFVSPDDLVFDVGANVGSRVRICLDLGARVVAFEPQRECLRKLERQFGADPRVTLDAHAVSDCEGAATLRIPESHTIASIEPGWVGAVRDSGRFAEYDWHDSEDVATTTLESAINSYGLPAFCKIDVEGSEEAVIAGLETAIPALSLEFTPEYQNGLRRSIEHLGELGDYEWNYSVGNSAELAFSDWRAPDQIRTFIVGYTDDEPGDLYARVRHFTTP